MRNAAVELIAVVALLAVGTARPSLAQESLLPPGPGRAEVIAACSDCHGISAVLQNRRTAKEWQDTIAQMQMEGSFIPEQNVSAMVQYLATNFGAPSEPDALPAPGLAPGPAAK
jgi:hypothetical protein